MRFYSTFFVDNLLNDDKYAYPQADIFKLYPEKLLKLYELCFNSFIVNSNKECQLIVDDISYQYIKKYTNITDNYLLKYNYPLLPEYKQTWSLPKLYCYQYLCSKGDPFLFFDLDIILLQPICEKFLSSDLFVLEKNPPHQIKDWKVDIFIKFLQQNPEVNSNKQILSFLENINFNIKNLTMANCAIFGGNNLENIMNYSNLAINNCLDEKNKFFWNDKFYITEFGFEKACILEQFLLSLIFNIKENKIILLDEYYKENNIPYVLTHIASDKNYLKHPKVTPELLFNVIYKILKKYNVKYFMDLYFNPEKYDFTKLNFCKNEKILFSTLINNFLKNLSDHDKKT